MRLTLRCIAHALNALDSALNDIANTIRNEYPAHYPAIREVSRNVTLARRRLAELLDRMIDSGVN